MSYRSTKKAIRFLQSLDDAHKKHHHNAESAQHTRVDAHHHVAHEARKQQHSGSKVAQPHHKTKGRIHHDHHNRSQDHIVHKVHQVVHQGRKIRVRFAHHDRTHVKKHGATGKHLLGRKKLRQDHKQKIAIHSVNHDRSHKDKVHQRHHLTGKITHLHQKEGHHSHLIHHDHPRDHDAQKKHHAGDKNAHPRHKEGHHDHANNHDTPKKHHDRDVGKTTHQYHKEGHHLHLVHHHHHHTHKHDGDARKAVPQYHEEKNSVHVVHHDHAGKHGHDAHNKHLLGDTAKHPLHKLKDSLHHAHDDRPHDSATHKEHPVHHVTHQHKEGGHVRPTNHGRKDVQTTTADHEAYHFYKNHDSTNHSVWPFSKKPAVHLEKDKAEAHRGEPHLDPNTEVKRHRDHDPRIGGGENGDDMPVRGVDPSAATYSNQHGHGRPGKRARRMGASSVIVDPEPRMFATLQRNPNDTAAHPHGRDRPGVLQDDAVVSRGIFGRSKNLTILVDRPANRLGMFRPGEIVSGRVILDVNHSTTLSDVNIELWGQSTSWLETTHGPMLLERVDLFRTRGIRLLSKPTPVLAGHTHEWSFEFELPRVTEGYRSDKAQRTNAIDFVCGPHTLPPTSGMIYEWRAVPTPGAILYGLVAEVGLDRSLNKHVRAKLLIEVTSWLDESPSSPKQTVQCPLGERQRWSGPVHQRLFLHIGSSSITSPVLDFQAFMDVHLPQSMTEPMSLAISVRHQIGSHTTSRLIVTNINLQLHEHWYERTDYVRGLVLSYRSNKLAASRFSYMHALPADGKSLPLIEGPSFQDFTSGIKTVPTFKSYVHSHSFALVVTAKIRHQDSGHVFKLSTEVEWIMTSLTSGAGSGPSGGNVAALARSSAAASNLGTPQKSGVRESAAPSLPVADVSKGSGAANASSHGSSAASSTASVYSGVVGGGKSRSNSVTAAESSPRGGSAINAIPSSNSSSALKTATAGGQSTLGPDAGDAGASASKTATASSQSTSGSGAGDAGGPGLKSEGSVASGSTSKIATAGSQSASASGASNGGGSGTKVVGNATSGSTSKSKGSAASGSASKTATLGSDSKADGTPASGSTSKSKGSAASGSASKTASSGTSTTSGSGVAQALSAWTKSKGYGAGGSKSSASSVATSANPIASAFKRRKAGNGASKPADKGSQGSTAASKDSGSGSKGTEVVTTTKVVPA